MGDRRRMDLSPSTNAIRCRSLPPMVDNKNYSTVEKNYSTVDKKHSINDSAKISVLNGKKLNENKMTSPYAERKSSDSGVRTSTYKVSGSKKT